MQPRMFCLSSDMPWRAYCRIRPRQLLKYAISFSILWIAVSVLWSHLKRSQKPLAFHEDNLDVNAQQKQLDYISVNLNVHFNLIKNFEDNFVAELTLTNKGNEIIQRCCWSIYFYCMNILFASNIHRELPRKFIHDDTLKKKESSSSGFEVNHVNGYTYRLKPTDRFSSLKSGDTLKVNLTGFKWIVSRSQVIPNWYVASSQASSSAEPRLLWSTVGEGLKFVGTFETPEKTSRSNRDALKPFTPEQRFEKNIIKNLGGAPKEILPTPFTENLQLLPKELHLESAGWTISYLRRLKNEALYLKENLKIESTVELSDSFILPCKAKTISLVMVEDFQLPGQNNGIRQEEAYRLIIDPENECISVAGSTSAGVFYGVVSIVSLAKPMSSGDYWFTGIEILDGPRFAHRGVMLDVARNFHAKEEIIRLLDTLAMYKMNKLHLHLTDDEGWRLEIPGLEELTQFGSIRAHDVEEQHHLMSMLGNGPFVNSSGSGFYTTSVYREILSHALSRHIEVIPEFDIPGHSHAAIKSMEYRRRNLIRDGYPMQADDYLLSDLNDSSSYLSAQVFVDSAINPCMESTYRFVQHVVDEVVKMHKDIMPLKQFHFGGDEVPKGAYSNSPACSQYYRNHENLSSAKDLKAHFIREISAIVAHHGLEVQGWEDAFADSSGKPIPLAELHSKTVISQAWYNIWESNFSRRAYEYANNGYKVILSPVTALYFDNPQEPDPEDWGLHWATRYVDIQRAFYFAPDTLFDNIDFDIWGSRISKSDLCGTKIHCPVLQSPKNILGMEAAVWSELIRTSDRLHSMLWPRLLAVAERSWHKANWEFMNMTCTGKNSCSQSNKRGKERKLSWTKFANTVGYKELKRLENLGINYYLPRPGARIVNGNLEVNTQFPGLIVQISLDDGNTWTDFDPNEKYAATVLLATRSFDGKRRSIPIKVSVI